MFKKKYITPFKQSHSDTLYKGLKIEKLPNFIKNQNYIQNKNCICYLRTFMVFNSNKQKEIEKFESYSEDQKILLEIKVDENSTIDENKLSCISLEEFNENQQDKEILFFPFSCFSIAAIEEDRNFDKKIILKYLSSKEIEIENEEEVGVTSFKKDFIGSNIADRKKTKEFDESLQNYENTATAQFKINKKEINQEIKLINPENNEIKDNVIISLDTSRFK